MSADQHRRVAKYADGLVDPEWRLTGTFKGVEWVTDRYVMVRTDMFTRKVTARDPYNVRTTLRDKTFRAVLSGIPRDQPHCPMTGFTMDRTWDGACEAGFVATPDHTLLPFDNRVRPLLQACDLLSVHGKRVIGFQRRRGHARPVLVCVVMGLVRFAFTDGHYVREERAS